MSTYLLSQEARSGPLIEHGGRARDVAAIQEAQIDVACGGRRDACQGGVCVCVCVCVCVFVFVCVCVCVCVCECIHSV